MENRSPSGSASAQPPVDLHQRGAFAIDRHFHLDIADGAAEQRPGRLAVQQQLELVFAVGGEVVGDDGAAAGAERRAVEAVLLRARARDVVGHRGGVGGRIADGEAADVRRRTHVALHRRRRRHLHVGDVVEAGADGVGGQEGVDVDVESEQRFDRRGVLGAIQALE